MKRILAYLLMFMATLFVATPCWAAWTVADEGAGVVMVTPGSDYASTNLDLASTYAQGLNIWYISVFSTDGETGNHAAIYSSSRAVTLAFPNCPTIDGSGQLGYGPPRPIAPYIKGSECSFTTPANCRILFVLKPKGQ